MKTIWKYMPKKEYLLLVLDLFVGIYAIWFVEEAKWKFYFLTLCTHGVNLSLCKFFTDKGWTRCQRIAEYVDKVLLFVIVIGGSIVVVVGL